MSDLLNNTSAETLIKDTTTGEFVVDVIEESKKQPVMVDFWAPWCGPCRQLTPIIEAAVKKAAGQVKLVKMNIDEHPEIPGQMGVQSIPAVIAFKDGRPLDGFMGAIPESQIDQFIEKIAGPVGPSPLDEALEEAEKLLESGEFDRAAGLFGGVFQQDPTNLTAITGLARCAIDLGNPDQANDILERIPEDQQKDPAVSTLRAQLDLLKKADGGDELEALLAKTVENPDDHQARFDLAIALNNAGKRQDAADALLEIFRRDRSWNDDGARKELLVFFEAWGPKDQATLKARRQLSSMMFS